MGPFTASQLKDHAQSGKLVPDSLIRLEGTDRWIEAYKFKNFDFSETIKPHQYAPPVAESSQNYSPYLCTQCGLELGRLKGLEGKKILCQHCKKITLVVSPKPVANQFESNVSANRLSTDVDLGDTAEVDFTPAPAWKNQKQRSQTRGYKANNPKSGSGVIYVIFGACIVGGLLLLIVGVGITTLVGRPGPEVFRATAEKISGDGRIVATPPPIQAAPMVYFSSLTQLLEGLPENNLPKGGSDGAIEMRYANEWLEKRVIGNSLLVSLKVKGVYLSEHDGKYHAAIYFDAETIPNLRVLFWGGESKIGKDLYEAEVLFQQDVIEFKPYISSNKDLDESQARKVRDLKGKNITLKVLIEKANFKQSFDGKHQFEVWMRSKHVVVDGLDLPTWNASPS